MTYRRTTSFSKKTVSMVPPPRSSLKPAGPVPARYAGEAPEADEIEDPWAAHSASPKTARPTRWIFLGTLLLLCGIAGMVAFKLVPRRTGGESAPPAPLAVNPAGSPATVQSAPRPVGHPASAQTLPAFIPQVPPDAPYAASHPGWERYRDETLEYLVYRDKGSVRAVQVLSKAPQGITTPFFKACLRLSSGQDQYLARKTELRQGTEVITGELHNGQELILYREGRGGEIQGFVITYPVSEPSRGAN